MKTLCAAAPPVLRQEQARADINSNTETAILFNKAGTGGRLLARPACLLAWCIACRWRNPFLPAMLHIGRLS